MFVNFKDRRLHLFIKKWNEVSGDWQSLTIDEKSKAIEMYVGGVCINVINQVL